jgi:hypothetical protein
MRRVLVVCTFVVVVMTFLLVLAPGAGASLPPEWGWQWTQPYTMPAPVPMAQLLAAGPDGSVYVGGNTYSYQWTVSRVDAEGAEVWSQTTLGPDDAGASPAAFATDAQRNLIVVGRSQTRGGDIYVVKYKASDGSVLWQKRWNGTAGLYELASAVAVDKAGNVYVAGSTTAASSHYDGVVLKYDATGHFKWKYLLATAREDFLNACGLDGSGNLYATGKRNAEMGEAEIVTLKLSPSGRKLWQRGAGGLGVDYGARFLRVRGTSVTVIGEVNVNGAKPVILRYTLAGKRTWAAANTPALDYITDAIVDAKGRVILIGSDTTSFGGNPAIRVGILHVYDAGSKWPGTSAMFWGDFDVDVKWAVDFSRVAVDSTGRIFCTGTLSTSGTGLEANALVVSFPPTTATPWTGADRIWRYDGPASGVDEFFGLLRVSDTAFYACGYRRGGGGTMEAIVHRLAVVPG